ncbi:MAG: 1-deoxy-D-xylulose-5-phosphate synthase N-terminal domain-containing protein [Phycisphaerales bacterium]
MRLSQSYSEFKKAAKQLSKKVPGGETLAEMYHRLGEMSKAVISEDAWFEKFGLVTIGPVDGHDLPTLIDFLNEAKHLDRPMVLHVKTIKGKGFEFAEKDACTFHSPAAFAMNVEPDGCRVELKKGGRPSRRPSAT